MVYIKFSAFESHSSAETSSETIIGIGDLIDGFALGQPYLGWNYNLRAVRLAPLALFPLFLLTKVAKYNLKPTGMTQGLLFSTNSTHYPSETCKQKMQNGCMHAAVFLKKNQTFCFGKTDKICLSFVKFLLKLTETWKNLKKPFNVSGSNLMFLMFHFFLLNLDWNPQSLEGKISKETLKLNERTKIKDFFANVFKYWIEYINPKKVSPRKIQKISFSLFLLTEFRFLLTHTIGQKSAEKTQKNQYWPSPHSAEILGEDKETSFWNLIQINKSEKLKTDEILDWKKLKLYVDISTSIFPIDKINSVSKNKN